MLATTLPRRKLEHQTARAPGLTASTSNLDVPLAPPVDQRHGTKVGRIVRKEYLQPALLEPARRAELIDKLYGVYNDRVYGITPEDLAAQIFGAEEGRLALFYGAGGELGGFSYANFERLRHAGRDHAVIAAGVYFRPHYQGGLYAAIFGLRQALRFKLREPRTPLAYCTRSSSPAPYRLLASTMPRLYPSRSNPIPASVEALVRGLSARWKYAAVNEGSWIVRSVATPCDPSRLSRLESDPNARFYTEVNPRFAEGESLLVWIPLDMANIAGGLFRALRARLTR
jgi:hypothetical protein